MLSRDDLMDIYHGYQYIPFVQRIERFLTHVENNLTKIMDDEIEKHQKGYNFIVDSFLQNSGLTTKETQDTIKNLEKVLKNKTNRARNEFKEIRKSIKAQLKAPDVLSIFKQLLSQEVLQSFEKEIGTRPYQSCLRTTVRHS